MSHRDEPTDYRIVVHGEVGTRFAQVFDQLAVQRSDGASTLVGPIRDGAELQGVLDLLGGLNLTILSVERSTP